MRPWIQTPPGFSRWCFNFTARRPHQNFRRHHRALAGGTSISQLLKSKRNTERFEMCVVIKLKYHRLKPGGVRATLCRNLTQNVTLPLPVLSSLDTRNNVIRSTGTHSGVDTGKHASAVLLYYPKALINLRSHLCLRLPELLRSSHLAEC